MVKDRYNQSINQLINQSIDKSINQSVLIKTDSSLYHELDNSVKVTIAGHHEILDPRRLKKLTWNLYGENFTGVLWNGWKTAQEHCLSVWSGYCSRMCKHLCRFVTSLGRIQILTAMARNLVIECGCIRALGRVKGQHTNNHLLKWFTKPEIVHTW